MNSSDVLRKHGIGVIAGIKLVSLLGYALQSQGVMDMGVYRYQFLQNRAYNPIVYSLLANKKYINSVFLDQIDQNLA